MARAFERAYSLWKRAQLRFVSFLHLKPVARRKAWLLLGALVAVNVVFFLSAPTMAQETTAAGETAEAVGTAAGLLEIPVVGPQVAGAYTAYKLASGAGGAVAGMAVSAILANVIIIISTILYLIVMLLVGLTSALTFILIKAASYNNFVHASAVTLGWVLVRDVVNMFFIVVLLIIAFSTIIGYKEFHYKQYLPKLLLMAVLINFSRTLVGIMIDFSQVITLTFVNGFKAAAFGNFVNAFGITGLLSTVKTIGGDVVSGNVSKTTQDLGSIVVSLIFAIAILTVAVTVITILVLYFVVRVIMLWILLILSPIAFFATALPGKMQKAMSAMTQDWWNRLSAWLTGGPIVAFFLWLSLAVLQQNNSDFQQFAAPAGGESQEQFSATMTEMGKPQNIGKLIVSVAMMLAGLNTAVAVSQQAAPKLGEIAGKIKASGGPVTWTARKAGRAAGRAAAPYAGRLAGRAGARIQAAAPAFGKVPVIGGILAGAVTRGAAAGKRVERGVRVAAEERAEERFKGLSTGDQLSQIDTMLAARGAGMRPDTRAAYERKRSLLLTKGDGQKAIVDDEIKQRGGLEGLSPAAKQQREQDANSAARTRTRGSLASGMASAKANGDSEMVDKLDEAFKKDPSLHQNIEDVYKSVDGNDEKDRKADAYKDTAVVAALMAKLKFADKDSGLTKPVEEILEHESMKELVKGDRGTYIKAALNDFATSDGGANLRTMLDPAARDTAAGQGARQQMSKSADGQQIVFAGAGGQMRSVPMKDIERGRRRFTDPNQLTAGLAGNPALQAQAASDLGTLGARPEQFNAPLNQAQAQSLHDVSQVYGGAVPAGGYSDVQRADLASAQAGGIPSTVAMNYDTAADAFRTDAARNAAQQTYADLMNGAASADPQEQGQSISFMANTDAEAVAKGGQMRDVVAKALNTHADKIKTLFANATVEQGKQLKAMMKELSKQAEAAINRGGAATPGEKDLVELRGKLGGKTMRTLGGESKKKGTA